MPAYQFRCLECKESIENVQKITEMVKPNCPRCGEEMETVISAPVFVLKGSGWAKDGYSK